MESCLSSVNRKKSTLDFSLKIGIESLSLFSKIAVYIAILLINLFLILIKSLKKSLFNILSPSFISWVLKINFKKSHWQFIPSNTRKFHQMLRSFSIFKILFGYELGIFIFK